MHRIRKATAEDARTIARQRVLMFQDNDLPCVATWDELERESGPWTAAKIADGSYAGFLVEEDGEIVGGAGVWFMEWPPHFMHLEPVRGYLLNFYVAPQARGRGIAKELVSAAVEECRRRGVKVAVLHASAMGRPVYEAMGWEAGNEMMLRVAEVDRG
jgi:GNAT superfamily N-acetyltransferase